jgi:RNA polymerase sigma-70 factor (ECF subfamily)
MTSLRPEPPPSPANGAAGIDWSAALEEHGSWMRWVVKSRLADTHAVHDVLQEVALAVLTQNSRPTAPEKVAPWLYRITLRHTVNYRRRHGRQRRLIERFARHVDQHGPRTSNPRDWVLAEEAQQCVSEALDELPPSSREVLLLKYHEGWSYRQLAEHLGVKEKTVEYRLMKARRSLRLRLKDRGFEEKPS